MGINLFKSIKNLINRPVSFEKLSDGKYRIFGIEYSANQILEISANGHQTLDGNKDYYFKPEFSIGKNYEYYTKEKFKYLAELGKEYCVNIDSAILVPTKNKSGLYAKSAPRTMPRAYDFSKPSKYCRVLCIPFEKNKGAMPFGIFATEGESLYSFTIFAVYGTMLNLATGKLFRDAFRMAFGRTAKECAKKR